VCTATSPILPPKVGGSALKFPARSGASKLASIAAVFCIRSAVAGMLQGDCTVANAQNPEKGWVLREGNL